MATKKQVEEAIFEREGFKVVLDVFEGKKSALPAYEWKVMAPQRWRISDWKNNRLEPYRLLVKHLTVHRGDGAVVTRDMQLGNLRDTYYEAEYGPVRSETTSRAGEDDKVVDLAKRRAGSSPRVRRS